MAARAVALAAARAAAARAEEATVVAGWAAAGSAAAAKGEEATEVFRNFLVAMLAMMSGCPSSNRVQPIRKPTR